MAPKILPQIKNIVFLMLENRSLDNVLGWLYGSSRPSNVYPAGSSPVYDGLVPNKFFNPSRTWTGAVKRYPVIPVPDGLGADHDRVPAYDPYEEFKTEGPWNGVMNQLFGNENIIRGLPTPFESADCLGFLQDYYATYMLSWQGLDILWTYTPKQLPVINSLARQYAVSDRWFCSVPSQTNPNRAFSLCGTSLGRESNANIRADETFDVPTVFNALTAVGKSWGLYYISPWHGKSYTEYTFPWITKARANGDVANMDRFFERAKSGRLPDFTYLEPEWGYGKGSFFTQGTDYHPPTHVTPGERFLQSVYDALRGSPQWNQMLFIVTFDEHGGTYDHVGPQWKALNPDGRVGHNGFRFDLFGARVPTLLISPFVPKSTVFREPAGSPFPYDHTSFIKTLLLWAGVDLNQVNFGKRMPAAPTFEGVLADHIVNDERVTVRGPVIMESVEAPSAPGMEEAPPAGAGQPLNALFEGVDFAATRAILARNDTLGAIHDDIVEYRKDPEKFEAQLRSGGV